MSLSHFSKLLTQLSLRHSKQRRPQYHDQPHHPSCIGLVNVLCHHKVAEIKRQVSSVDKKQQNEMYIGQGMMLTHWIMPHSWRCQECVKRSRPAKELCSHMRYHRNFGGRLLQSGWQTVHSKYIVNFLFSSVPKCLLVLKRL